MKKHNLNQTDNNTSCVSVVNNNAVLSQKKSLTDPSTKSNPKLKDGFMIHDVLIIGAGPAALTAAIYTARDDIETIVYEKSLIGGIPSTTDWIENYPGFPDGISGQDFCDNMQRQAERFGVKIELAEVTGLCRTNDCIKLSTSDGDQYAKAVLVASGCHNKKLNVPGEAKYCSKGVHYCATCDGAFYRDKKVVVVGGGNSAVQEALFLTRFASHVDLLVRSTIRASDILVHKLGQNNKITVHLHTTIDEIIGNDSHVTEVVGTNVKTDEKIHFKTDGVFVFVGQIPNTSFLVNCGVLFDEAGFVKTDERLQTNVKGVFVAGDARSGATMQIACATGEGATAAMSIREYLHHHPKLNYDNFEQ